MTDLFAEAGFFREALGFTRQQYGFPERLIEKDYLCSLLLEYLSDAQENLVFKGGTCLAKVHADFYRLSEDLDFVIPMRTDASRTARSRTAEGLKAIIAICKEKAPKAVILVTSLTPRNDNRQANEVIRRVNAELLQMADGRQVIYVNLHAALADDSGRLRTDMTTDGLHFNQAAYQAWADLLKPVLQERLGPPGKDDHAPPATGDPSAKTTRPR